VARQGRALTPTRAVVVAVGAAGVDTAVGVAAKAVVVAVEVV
jgi:hypothetical protein